MKTFIFKPRNYVCKHLKLNRKWQRPAHRGHSQTTCRWSVAGATLFARCHHQRRHNNTLAPRTHASPTHFYSHKPHIQRNKTEIAIATICPVQFQFVASFTQNRKGTLSVFRRVPRTSIDSVHIIWHGVCIVSIVRQTPTSRAVSWQTRLENFELFPCAVVSFLNWVTDNT